MIFKWVSESIRVLSVTTYHPIGWSFLKFQNEVERRFKIRKAVEADLSSPIILVHGILHNSSAFYRIEKRLKRQKFSRIKTLELWTSVQKLEDMADQLKREVRFQLSQIPQRGAQAQIIAHSLGGIVVRAALLDPDFAQSVNRVVFLGTPHRGSYLSKMVPFPKCLRDLSKNDSEWIKRFENEPLPGNIQYWNLRGQMDVITPGAETFLPHVNNLIFEGVGHAGLLSSRKVLSTLVEILESDY